VLADRENGSGRERENEDMAGITAIIFELYWQREVDALRMTYEKVMDTHPAAKKAMEKVHEVLSDIACPAVCTPREVSESKEMGEYSRKI
jgi:hypothetical protein